MNSQPNDVALSYWKFSQHYNKLDNEVERDRFIQFVVIPAANQDKLLSRLVERHNQSKAA